MQAITRSSFVSPRATVAGRTWIEAKESSIMIPPNRRFFRTTVHLAAILLAISLGIVLQARAAPRDPTQVNIALGKPALASSIESAFLAAENVNDGDVQTRWSSQFADNEWIRIDLEDSYFIQQIVLNWETAYGKSYDIEVSDDGFNWETIFEERDGDGGLDVINLGRPVSARYVRMFGLLRGTGFGFSLWEFEIYESDPAHRFVAFNGVDEGNDCLDAEDPCATITHAISLANPGNTIEIGPGAYTESFFIDKSLTLQGAGQSSTIVQAHSQPGLASTRVIAIPSGLEVQIADLTIRHGKVSGSGAGGEGGGIFVRSSYLTLTNVTLAANEARSGGGLYNKDGRSATLRNVTFNANRAAVVGGGMRNFGGSNSSLRNVTFTANEADRGGGMGNNGGAHVLTDVTFSDNSARLGSGLYNVNVSEVLTGALFEGNEATENGGGMYNNGSSPVTRNVTFRENVAGNGGGIYNTNDSSPALINVVLAGNEATGGGGMINLDSSSPRMLNVAFSMNRATAVGGAILNLDTSAPRMSNTIVWGNMAGADGNEIYNESNASCEVRYSLYKDGTGDIVEGGGFDVDANSLSEDPLFVDAASGDLRLQEGSPAINAGDPDTDLTLYPVDDQQDPIDLAGNPRVQEERIDMGAFEYGSRLYGLYLPLVVR